MRSRSLRILVPVLLLAAAGCYGGKKESPKPAGSAADEPAPADSMARAYEDARHVVYLQADLDADGNVVEVRPLDLAPAPAAVIDSLEAIVKGWILNPPAERGGAAGPAQVVIPFALDRRAEAAGAEAGSRLPPAVRDTLTLGSLRPWADGWREIDPEFSLDDFISPGPVPLSEGGWPDSLNEPDLVGREARGMLRVSADGRWVLDPFAGVRFAPEDAESLYANQGFSLACKDAGRRCYHQLSPHSRVWLATWLDNDTFLALGLIELSHTGSGKGAKKAFSAPAIWLGEPETGTITLFRGAPITPEERPAVRAFELRLRKEAFPKVDWKG